MLILKNSVGSTIEKADFKVGAAKELPIIQRDSWDGPRAKKNIFSFADFDTDNPKSAKAKRAFLIYDAENPDLKGSYKLPFADVVDGKLVAIDRGLRAAASRLPQTDAPEAVKNRARRVLDSYFERMDDKSLDDLLTQKSAHIQVLKLIFDSGIFNVESAMAWASAHGFNVPERTPEDKGGEIILEQNSGDIFDPDSLIRNQITEGVVALVGETPEKQGKSKNEGVLHFSIESTLEKQKDDGPHTFTAFATTFGNVDLDGDIILPGAVDEAIRKVMLGGKFPKILKDHDRTQRPAVMTSIVANDKGVLVEGKFLDTQLGQDTFIEVRDGAITDMSIGFFIPMGGGEMVDREFVISKLDFREVSFVTFPANEEANIISVKDTHPLAIRPCSKPETIREFEKLLRDVAGFSVKEATKIASAGFSVPKGRDVSLMQSIVDNLKSTTQEMRTKNDSDIRKNSGTSGRSPKDVSPV